MGRPVNLVSVEDRIEDIDALIATYRARIVRLRKEARNIFQFVARVNLTKFGSLKDKEIAAHPYFHRVLSKSDRIGYGS